MVTAILLAQVVNYAFNPRNLLYLPTPFWHIQFALGGIFGVGIVVVGCYVPESKVWLAKREKERQQKLKKLAETRKEWVSEMEEKARAGKTENPVAVDFAAPLPRQIQHASLRSRSRVLTHSGWSGLIHFSNCRWLGLAFLLAAGNQLTGINAIMYYAPRIFEDAGFQSLALVLTIAVVSTTAERIESPQYLRAAQIRMRLFFQVGTWNVLATLLSIPLLKHLGRRTMLLIAHSIMAAGLALITFAYAFIPHNRAIPSIFAIILFILGFEVGPGPLFFVIASDSFPQSVLHAGLSLTNQLAWLCNILITFLFPLLSTAIGSAGTFGIFLFICIASTIGDAFFLPSDADVPVMVPSPKPSSTVAEPHTISQAQTLLARRECALPNQLELMPSPPLPQRTSSPKSPPYQAKAQNQLPNQWESPQAASKRPKKHPMQSPIPSPDT